MPKNNGRRRKEWRKALADHNDAWWAKNDPGHKADRKGVETKPFGMKPYPLPARGEKPDTADDTGYVY